MGSGQVLDGRLTVSGSGSSEVCSRVYSVMDSEAAAAAKGCENDSEYSTRTALELFRRRRDSSYGKRHDKKKFKPKLVQAAPSKRVTERKVCSRLKF